MAILTVLAIGGAALGLVLAPPSADLVVQNAAGENLLVPSLSVHVVATETLHQGSLSQKQPTVVQHFVIHPTESTSKTTASGVRAASVVGILKTIADSSPWVRSPNSFLYGGDIGSLLGLSKTASGSATGGAPVHVESSGIARTWVQSGYLVAVHVRVAIQEGTLQLQANETITFTQVGDFHPSVQGLTS